RQGDEEPVLRAAPDGAGAAWSRAALAGQRHAGAGRARPDPPRRLALRTPRRPTPIVGSLPTMAYIVRRPRGGFEVRESTLTRKGPRSRTLAAFTLLSGDVIAHARSRSADPPDADALRRLAVRAGAPVAAARPDGAALALIAELASGRSVAPGLRRALLARLQGASDDDSLR